MSVPLPLLTAPPPFCEYAAGPCDQEFGATPSVKATFLYSARPEGIAATIEGAVDQLRRSEKGTIWTTWKEHATTGQIVFCRICQSMRFASHVIADVTTLNFNVLFEIGYAVGLGVPVVPIRDTTVLTSADDFDALGMLDTLGYVDFQNSNGLATALQAKLPVTSPFTSAPSINRESPLFVVRANIPTEGDVRLMSLLQRSGVHSRTFDANESPRLSLHEARRQVASSRAVLVHVMSTARRGAAVHNARCAIVAGMALAMQKSVMILEEDVSRQPIDYRDIVSPYRQPGDIPKLVEPFLLDVIELLQSVPFSAASTPARFLERVDLGDVAAENEAQGLKYYFVRTAQFTEAKRGTARLVVGRKGAGKTALFYGLRDAVPRGHDHLVLDLKPEGHQFTKLREVVLRHLSAGLQEHTLTAFWNYILLCEIAEKLRDRDYTWAQRDPERESLFSVVAETYAAQAPADGGDFSERLQAQVERITARFEAIGTKAAWTGGKLTEVLFRGDIRVLDDALGPYLSLKKSVWVLVDNLDKGWPTRGSRSEDILILRTLLEATRKLQRQLSQRDVDLHSLVFLRNDIYEHLLVETPDRGKDTSIILDWDDEAVFKEIIRERVRASTGEARSFEEVWSLLADPFVGTEDSFRYVLERSLMRPRDVLLFLQRAIGVALNRGHARIMGADILKAEESYSEDMLLGTAFELRDVRAGLKDLLYKFSAGRSSYSLAQVEELIADTLGPSGGTAEALELLLWFGFLGVREASSSSPRFAFQVRYNLDKLLTQVRSLGAQFVVHPAFRKALEIVSD